MNFDLSYAPTLIMAFMLIFARIGSMMMLMPGIADSYVPIMFRLIFALTLSLVLLPVLANKFSGFPVDIARFFSLMAYEIVIGVLIGLLARFIISTLQVAGTTIANQMGFSFSMTFDPVMGQQSQLISNYLTIFAMLLFFTSNLHHLVIMASIQSYKGFPPGQLFPAGDFLEASKMMVTNSFATGIQMSAPFIVMGLAFQGGLAILSRMMPQLQVFFISIPVSIIIGIFVLMFVFATIFTWYLDHATVMLRFLAGG